MSDHKCIWLSPTCEKDIPTYPFGVRKVIRYSALQAVNEPGLLSPFRATGKGGRVRRCIIKPPLHLGLGFPLSQRRGYSN